MIKKILNLLIVISFTVFAFALTTKAKAESVINEVDLIDVDDGYYVYNSNSQIKEIDENLVEIRSYYDSGYYYILKDNFDLSFEYVDLACDIINGGYIYRQVIYIKNGKQEKIPEVEKLFDNSFSGVLIACTDYENWYFVEYTDLADVSTWTIIKSIDYNQNGISFFLHKSIISSDLSKIDENSGDLLNYYFCYFENGKQININDINVYNEVFKDNDDFLLIDKEIFNSTYNINNYNTPIKINSFTVLNQYRGSTGKVVITHDNQKNTYIYDLYEKDSKRAFKLEMNGFLNGYDFYSITQCSYAILEDNNATCLILEIIFNQTDHVVYNLTTNKTATRSNLEITSTDWGYLQDGNIMEYYIYFNSSIPVDQWLSMEFDYEYHKEQKFFYLFNINYAKTKGSYLLTSTGKPLSSINKFDYYLSNHLFKYDDELRSNFTNSDFVINGNEYDYRLKFLVVGRSVDDILEGITSFWSTLFFNDDGYIVLDEFTAINVSYIKNGTTYNNIHVESNIDIDDKPVHDELDSINIWSVKDFLGGLKNAIETDTLGEHIINYFFAFIISILLLIVILYIIINVFKFIFIGKRRYYYKR